MSFLEYQKQSPEFLNNYLKYVRYITFRAETTVDETYFDLRTFFRFVKIINIDKERIYNISVSEFKNTTIIDVTLEHINKVTQDTITKFLYFCSDTLENDVKTRNRKLASVRKFFEYLSTNNLILYNPAEHFKSARVEERVANCLNLKQSKTLLSKTINSNQRFKIRNYAMTCLFLNCGVRLTELIEINLTNFKLDEKTLKVRGKGNIERILYLNDATCEAIQEYLKVRPKLGIENPDHKALFISGQNKRISQRSVQTIMDQELYMTFGEKRKGYHTHTLRHTSATLMYNENDTDIVVIRKILGHKSLSTTEKYTHVSSKKMKAFMENCTISSILEKRGGIKDGK